ncbi:MAG: Carbamoyl-phosphate synthase small chain [Sodalis sp.]|nr:MAG: Carbamoyl-phosphate synthase small chain [Sodalis sp.]
MGQAQYWDQAQYHAHTGGSGCRLTMILTQAPAETVLAMNPMAGNPALYAYATQSSNLSADIPLFGICLSHQLLALASGAKMVKMKSVTTTATIL